jgi:hypothetical protein
VRGEWPRVVAGGLLWRQWLEVAEFVARGGRDVVARGAALADLGSVAVGVIGDGPSRRVRRHALQAAQGVVGEGLIQSGICCGCCCAVVGVFGDAVGGVISDVTDDIAQAQTHDAAVQVVNPFISLRACGQLPISSKQKTFA